MPKLQVTGPPPPRNRAARTNAAFLAEIGRVKKLFFAAAIWLASAAGALPALAAEPTSALPPEAIAKMLAFASPCQARLADGLAIFQPLPPLVGEGACGAMEAIRLEEIVLADGARISLTTPAILRCPMAEAVAHWVRDDVAPAAGRLGAPLRAIENYGSYECRGRNRVVGAKLSEHGLADALDVRGIKLADGRLIPFGRSVGALEFREEMRAAACARFATVLGPASDGYHEDHIHFDLAERRNGFKLCQWDVRDFVPLPRPRPKLQADAKPDAESIPADAE